MTPYSNNCFNSQQHNNNNNNSIKNSAPTIAAAAVLLPAAVFNVLLKMMGEPEWRSQLQHSHSNMGAIPINNKNNNNNFYAPSQQERNSTSNYLKNFTRFGAVSNLNNKPIGLDIKIKNRTASANSAQTMNLGTGEGVGNGGEGSSTLTNTEANGSGGALDYTTTTTTTTGSSSSNSGIEYKRKHRCILPSITTTSDTTPSECYSSNQDELLYGNSLINGVGSINSTNSGCANNEQVLLDDDAINYRYLYAISNASNSTRSSTSQQQQAPPFPPPPPAAAAAAARNELRRSSNKEATLSHKNHTTIRRVASFTYSPEGSIDKHNKRNNENNATVGINNVSNTTRKFTLGSLGKTFNYLKNKVDTAISTSSLYPTKEECRLWQDSFEALLNNKYGCMLFRQFLKMEFSVENLEFWLECEEFKKLKEGKKATQQRAHAIYNTFVRDKAEKEVNLDSATKAATKGAIESGIRSDIFNLAQIKIEQLMEKDSYQRFLKSEQYLELLNGINRSSSPNEKANNNNPIPLRNNGPILRTTSAKEPSATRKNVMSTGTNAIRRNTCHLPNENTQSDNSSKQLVVQI